MKINSNITAVITNNYLHRSEKSLSKSTERLSSGYKINNASDNPAGYAISSKMRSQLKSLEKASNNADTAVNFIQTGEGALSEMHDMIQRLNELAVKASNGTLTEADRDAVQKEVNQLCEEMERMAQTTEFNDQNIIDGNFEYRGYTDNENIKVLNYSDVTKTGTFNLTIGGSADAPVVTGTDDIADGMESSFDSDTNLLTIKASDGSQIVLDMTNGFETGDVEVNLTGIGAMRIQIGANEGQILEMNIPEISLRKMGIDNLDVMTQDSARESIDRISNALDYVSDVRSKFGAYENRLNHIVASLDITQESLTSSYSTIVDTDMAAEMTEFTKLQILQQAGTSMLAQANQFPQQALQLLQ